MKLPSRLACAGGVLGLCLAAAALPATAQPSPPPPPVVGEQDVMPHLHALQRIADRNGGNRAHGTKGFSDSVAYVKTALDKAGFITRLQPFAHRGARGYNLIADWPGGDPHHVVLAGAHLDSVKQGPGINDNGSGSAAVLTTALQVARHHLRPERHLRFAWWGAEEVGLRGSKAYVKSLSGADRETIDVYLNLDQAGAKRVKQWLLVRGGPKVTDAFENYFAAHTLPTFDVGTDGSDGKSFDNADIPVSGFSSGISDCLHEPCDDIHNVDPANEAIATNAMLAGTWQLATTKAPKENPHA